MKKTYLYLAHRSKKGIKILATLFVKNDHFASKILDASKIGLPDSLQMKIVKQAHDDRMLWELWVETAENFLELKKGLKNRGYTDLPLSCNPLFETEIESVVSKVQKKTDLIIKSVEKPKKTMLRRMKD